jgi:dTDP-4-amino-4,6-dideoxygalactose transaminase
MTDIQAAVGREQLKRLPTVVAQRRELAARYQQQLAGSGLPAPIEPAWARSNWQSYCVRLPADVDQRPVMQALLDAGIASRRGIMCSHRERAYVGQPLKFSLHESELAQDQCILVPLYPQMGSSEVDEVAAALCALCRSTPREATLADNP